MTEHRPRLYSELAHWWPLFSPPLHYVEEAADVIPTLLSALDAAPRTMLELGSGGGSMAFHIKQHVQLTLTDRSPDMLDVSRRVNPECEHLLGDMRTVNLGREFDLVMIHDAIMYLVEPESLRAAFATAYRHCRPGGAAVILPDCVTETLEPRTEDGGEDGADGRAMRYLEWVWDPDPHDTTFKAVYSLLFRDLDGTARLPALSLSPSRRAALGDLAFGSRLVAFAARYARPSGFQLSAGHHHHSLRSTLARFWLVILSTR